MWRRERAPAGALDRMLTTVTVQFGLRCRTRKASESGWGKRVDHDGGWGLSTDPYPNAKKRLVCFVFPSGSHGVMRRVAYR